jgi:aminoglycoside phosphotransferase (APT) family kinase protein
MAQLTARVRIPAHVIEQLSEVVGEALSQPVELHDLRRLTGGASRETWSFNAALSDGRSMPLILRRGTPGAPRKGSMTREALAIEAAFRAGVPEPAVLAYTDDDVTLGAQYVIMERIVGETIARRILRDEAFDAVRPRLAEQCGEILARIHSVPVDEVPGLERDDPLRGVRATLDSFDDPSPALELGMRWLTEHRPVPPREDVLLHGDFRNGNLIIGDDGIRSVLDWELVHRGDPMQDLGYLCVRAWRFGGPGPVGGFGAYEDLFRGYERVSGRSVDPDAVRWWEMFGTVWWGAGCMLQAARHLSGGERSVELAAIGRRVWEQEYDVMLLLDEGSEAA